MNPVNDFEQFCYDEICAALADIDTRNTPDIYVISFHVFDADDDPRYPVLQLGYNTRTRVAECAQSASNVEEATWNYAFWLQNEIRFIGEAGTQGAKLLEDLLRTKGLWYSDEEDDADFDRCEQLASDITAYFVNAWVRIARALHTDGVIARQFSGQVPIVIHELEYYDDIAIQTRRANPPGWTNDFESWIASMYAR
jgi:hypothetical protein